MGFLSSYMYLLPPMVGKHLMSMTADELQVNSTHAFAAIGVLETELMGSSVKNKTSGHHSQCAAKGRVCS